MKKYFFGKPADQIMEERFLERQEAFNRDWDERIARLGKMIEDTYSDLPEKDAYEETKVSIDKTPSRESITINPQPNVINVYVINTAYINSNQETPLVTKIK